MKTILPFLLLLFTVEALAQQACFPETDYDCGPVRRDTVLVHRFRFLNEGTEALEVLSAISTCPCVRAEVPLRTVPPGGEGEVLVTFRGEGRRLGDFRQLVRVYTNAAEKPVNLHLKGTLLSGR